jgi:hypothetical protein
MTACLKAMAERFEIMKLPHRFRAARAILYVFAAVTGSSVFADFYVATNGSDAGAGTIASPFATLEKARDAVRAANRSGLIAGGAITVWLRGGDYVRTNALVLSAVDSGTEGARVIWRGYGDEHVRLLGGRILTGFQPVKDLAVLSRLDESTRSHVVQLELRTLGITNFGEMHSRGFARATTPAHCELFFGHQPMTLARWPNEGAWEKLAGFPAGSGKGDEHGGSIGDLAGGFTYAGDRPRRWKETSDLWIHGFWAWDWANSYERIDSLDLDKRIVKTAAPYGLYGFRAGQRFCWLNVLEELDQPGEWFLDRKSGTLYFWPPSDIASGETLLSVLDEPLVKMTEARYITIQGITLEATRGNGVEIMGGTGDLIVGCRLRNLGNMGVVISGGTNQGVASCDVLDTGDGGVSLSGGDRQTLTSANHFVENCHFQRQARWSKCYAPCVQLSGVGLRVSHNLMYDHPHCAILFTGNDHLIEFNDIHHIALETGDVGAIYTGRDYTFRGNRIRHNFIHETGGVGMGSMGVYMDDCVSGTEIFGNVFYKTHWAILLGGGRDHHVENNLFVDCDPAIRADGRGLDTSPVWRDMVDTFMRQQMAAVPATLYRERYPAMKTLDAAYGPPDGPSLKGAAFKGVAPEGNVITRNICVGKWIETNWHATRSQFDLRDNYVSTDRGQVGAAVDGFPIVSDSPAWKTGFKPIPFDQIGIHPNPDRARLSR